MKFKVSSKVKGSLILKSIGRPMSAGTTVYVEGQKLYADDIQRAIKSGLLTPSNPEEKIKIKEQIINKTSEVVIINKTDRVVIIGNIPIRPNGSAIKDISQLDMNAIKKSIEKGLIQVIYDIDEELFEDDVVKENCKTSEPTTESKKDVEESTIDTTPSEEEEFEKDIEILEDPPSLNDKSLDLANEWDEIKESEEEEENGEKEPESKAIVWNLRTQKPEKPKVVPKTGQKIVDLEQDYDNDVDIIDALDQVNDIKEDDEVNLISNKIENIQKKIAQNKTSKKSSKKKDTKVIKLKINEETETNIVQSLDSMGNPLKEDMTHMVNGFDNNEVSFVDQEQAQKNIDEAKKRDLSINIDLDLG